METSYLHALLSQHSTQTEGVLERSEYKVNKNELLGEEDELDDLTLLLQGHESPSWNEIYTKSDTSDKSPVPTNVLSAHERHNLLFKKIYEHIFARTVRPDPANVPPLKLEVNVDEWKKGRQNKLPPRDQSAIKHAEIVKQTNDMINLNVIRPSQATEWAQVTVTPKPNNKWRYCIDFKSLNAVTKGMGYPLPNIQAMLQRIGRKKPKIFTVIDLTNGYHQMPMAA